MLGECGGVKSVGGDVAASYGKWNNLLGAWDAEECENNLLPLLTCHTKKEKSGDYVFLVGEFFYSLF